ncbi:MAG: UbiD family decarboxylase [Chloroflexi bacterium]|nr:UbiD family decarboxylase [Chloroflexota bacterium]
MPKDLRSYIREYEAAHPDEVLHIEKPISCKQEVTALVTKLEREGRYPIVICHNITTAGGQKSALPLVTNLMASRSRCAEAIGSTYRMVGMDYCEKTRDKRIAPVVISRSEAPVKEVVATGEAIDLTQYPALIHHAMDPGPYFTGGFMVIHDPDTGIDNCALHRGWIIDRRTVRFYLTTYTHNRQNMNKYEARGQEMPLAYWIGHHPAACLGAQARLAYPESHYDAIGGLLGEPLRLVPSETLGDDFLVPADAEVIVEGIARDWRRYPEGPFGEYTGYMGPQIPNPQFEVTAITHRKGAYWHDLLVGHPDNQVMGGFGIEGAIYEAVKRVVPSLSSVYVPLSATCRFHGYLQLTNPRRGDAREAIMAALPVDYRLKHVFAFDDDINIFDEREVLFAIATRTQWDKDLLVFTGTRGSELDPTIVEAVTTKGGLDCTKPAQEAFAERNTISGEAYERVRLEDFLALSQLDQIVTERM